MSVEKRIHEMLTEGICYLLIEPHLHLIRNPNMKDKNGYTLLHKAVCNATEYLPIVESLVRLGADVNVQDNNYRTPLLLATESRNYSIMNFLITQGAKINTQASNGRTALHYHIHNICIMEQMGKPWRTRMLKVMLQRGADPNLYDNNGETPLLLASRRNNLLAVKELLISGANVHLRNTRSATCLHLLLVHNGQPNKDIIFEMVKRKACVNCIDSQGRSVMDLILMHYQKEEGLKTLKLLIKTVTLVNWESKNIFDLCTNRNLDNLREFIDDCYTEVSRMRSFTYSDFSNLCQLALNRENFSQNEQPFAESIIDEVFKTLMKNCFNTYDHLITPYFNRKFLSKKFLNTIIYARDEMNKAVILSMDINHLLLPQLSDQDLINMARAYSKNLLVSSKN